MIYKKQFLKLEVKTKKNKNSKNKAKLPTQQRNCT